VKALFRERGTVAVRRQGDFLCRTSPQQHTFCGEKIPLSPVATVPLLRKGAFYKFFLAFAKKIKNFKKILDKTKLMLYNTYILNMYYTKGRLK
jgi:hypothetical protein